MNDDGSPLPYHTAQSGSGAGLFNTAVGKLQRQLHKGEYDVFRYAPIFESDFIQITKKGEVVDVHNQLCLVTVGIASTSPTLPLPDVLLLARPATGSAEPTRRRRATKGAKGKSQKAAAKSLELTRLLPLKFVRISIHDREKQQLRLRFATGRSCYLQLCPPPAARQDLFACWENLIGLLQRPAESDGTTYTAPARDRTRMPVFEEKDGRGPAVACLQEKEGQDPVGLRSPRVICGVAGATSAAFAGGEGIQYDWHRVTPTADVATPGTKPTELDKVSAAAAAVAAGTVAGALSVALTESAAPEPLSTARAGAAAAGPGRSDGRAAAGAARVAPQGVKVALAGAANNSSECPSNSSLSPEAGTVAARAKAEPTGKTVGEMPNNCVAAPGPLVSASPSGGSVADQAGRRHGVSPGEARRSRRDGRERGRALGSPHHRSPAQSRHKSGDDKILRKPAGQSLASQRTEQKAKGCSSPGGSRPVTANKGISRAPVTKDSWTSHKSGRSLFISSFLRNVKANLTTKTVASPRGKEVNGLTKTMEMSSVEAIMRTAESGPGLEVVGSVTSEVVETMTFEAY